MKDIYLKFGNPAIKGESADKDHAGWIEIDYATAFGNGFDGGRSYVRALRAR
jgi:hypothetical protein